MKKSTRLFLIPLLLALINSCTLQKGYIKFATKQPEIIVTQKLKDFIKKNSNPSIVLRVPGSGNHTTQSEQNSYLYNAIEKELIIGGFVVKDRGLFNEVLGKSNEVDYKKLKELTGADLILELVQCETSTSYKTNCYYNSEGTKFISTWGDFERNGATVEFKIILVETNEYGGSYSFYYNPCPEDNYKKCGCNFGYKELSSSTYRLPECSNNRYGYESIGEDVLENFVRVNMKKLISEIRQ